MELADIKIGMQVCYCDDMTDVFTVKNITEDGSIDCEQDGCFFEFGIEDLEIFDLEKTKIIVLDIQNHINTASSQLEDLFNTLKSIRKKAEDASINPFNKNVLAWEEFTHTLANGPYYWRISSLEC